MKNFMILLILPLLFSTVTLSAQDSAGVLFFDELFGRPDTKIKREHFNKVVKPELWKKLAEFHKKQYGLKSLVQRSSEWESSIENISKMQKGKAPKGFDGKPMNIHHIKPLALNGANKISNFKILSQSEHLSGTNYCKNHLELCDLKKARVLSKNGVKKALKYVPYISTFATAGSFVAVLHQNGWSEALNKREFYKDITMLSAGLGGSIILTELTAPFCIAAGTAFTPVAGTVCVIGFGILGYYGGEEASEAVFNFTIPETSKK